MKDKNSNRLIHATSPYLLQHAYNPVDWYEWGSEALKKAKAEDKPILVSIGYSSCHWCHVMERESFEDEQIAEIMNRNFVCIKVDREERPDIDQVYMDAVQALGVNGGWPLNVFLTPDQKPFYGGTYFPPSSWTQVLTHIHTVYQSKKTDVLASAETLTNHLTILRISQYKKKAEQADLRKFLELMYERLAEKFDRVWGGLGSAPKFIMPSIWLLLLRFNYITKNEDALAHTLFTLKKIAQGGIYDQVGGGFARYSVDKEWFAPHFEKMLYDNAQLLTLYSEAFQISKDDYFKSVVYETFEWIKREMTHADGGLYAALDADSEAIEGKYYTWSYKEILQTMGEQHGKLVADYFEATPEGNLPTGQAGWEYGTNILKQAEDIQSLRIAYNVSESELTSIIQSAKKKLLAVRETRIKPGLDDKILTAWNAMTIVGLIDAYHAFGDERFLTTAQKNASFIQKNLMEGEKLFRSFRGTRSATEGFLEDYAYYIQACIKLYQADFDEAWLQQAERTTVYVLSNFFDETDSYFFFTSAQAEKLITQKKEIFDNVIPAANGVMAQNLFHLGTLLDRNEWKSIAATMVSELSYLIQTEPSYMSNWGVLLTIINHGLAEVVFTGKDFLSLKGEFIKNYQPFSIVMGAHAMSTLPLLQGKLTEPHNSMIYVCFDKTCKRPVTTVADTMEQLA